MKRFTISTTIFFLFALIIVGGFLRFYNLDWGDPFYFHPDERNVASSISQLIFPTHFNPHFFAYGSFPIYLIFLIGLLANFAKQNILSFQQAIIVSRSFSCVLSILLIPSLFFITKRVSGSNIAAIFAAGLSTFSVGFIQFAHFGTFEMWLTFLGLWLFYFCFNIVNHGKFSDMTFAAIISGLLLGTKISGLILIPLPILCILYFVFFHKKYLSISFLEIAMQIFVYCFLLSAIYILTNPFVILDTGSFLDSMRYETQVATGALPVFYTGEFFTSKPVIFQVLHIYPFLLNPFVTIIFILCFFYVVFISVKTKKIPWILLIIFYLLLFISQAILFAKWTRYMIPTLPFVYIFISVCLFDLLQKKIISKLIMIILTISFVLVSTIYGLIYTQVAFGREDSRLSAVDFAKKSIPNAANIVSEVYDLGIVPFNSTYSHISLFNFYDLDNNGALSNNDLINALSHTEYIILPSQRILKPRITNILKFPNAGSFYRALFNGNLGYEKIYETPCDILCKIVYLNDPVFSLEETATVFDRPTVYIFKRISK